MNTGSSMLMMGGFQLHQKEMVLFRSMSTSNYNQEEEEEEEEEESSIAGSVSKCIDCNWLLC